MSFIGVSFNIIVSWTICISNLDGHEFNKKKDSYVLYLQLLANARFDFVKKNLSSQNTARDILVEENEMWLEDVVNVKNSNYEVISNTLIQDSIDTIRFALQTKS